MGPSRVSCLLEIGRCHRRGLTLGRSLSRQDPAQMRSRQGRRRQRCLMFAIPTFSPGALERDRDERRKGAHDQN
jgi:hypothetical protein